VTVDLHGHVPDRIGGDAMFEIQLQEGVERRVIAAAAACILT
jgi:hypothetical protein